MRFAIVLMALFATQVGAQTPPPAFEVASVKLVPPGTPQSRGGMRGGPRTSDPGRITITSSTLKFVLMKAYDLQHYQISGPPWLEEDRYEIVARVPEGATREAAMTMLQNLVIERFGLKLHLETRELPVYALKAGKNGHQLTPVDGEVDDDAQADFFSAPITRAKDGFADTGGLRSGYLESYVGDQGKITVIRQPLKTFTDRLSNRMDRPILDRTGLRGLFSFAVNYTPAHNTTINTATDDVAGDSIFNALKQQLGLHLEPIKGPVRFLVVDSGTRVPVDN